MITQEKNKKQGCQQAVLMPLVGAEYVLRQLYCPWKIIKSPLAIIVGIKYSISSKNFFDLHSFAFPTQSQHVKTKQQKEAPKSVGLLG